MIFTESIRTRFLLNKEKNIYINPKIFIFNSPNSVPIIARFVPVSKNSFQLTRKENL